MSSSPQPRPIFIAALHREIAALVSDSEDGRWQSDPTLRGKGIYLYWNDRAIVACAGMGAARATLAVEAALTLGPAAELVSVGWAGACLHRLQIGDVLLPDVVVDVRTGERFFPARERSRHEGLEVLATVPSPAGAAEKSRLAVSYYASAVDMEAATVARLARARDLPFQAIKAISDGADFELPSMQDFTTPTGQLREAAFGLHVALRPKLWNPVLTMAKSSKLAAARLRTHVEAHIAQIPKDRTRTS